MGYTEGVGWALEYVGECGEEEEEDTEGEGGVEGEEKYDGLGGLVKLCNCDVRVGRTSVKSIWSGRATLWAKGIFGFVSAGA